ncbi:protein VAC14 homolog [Bradysia coprophila]|uniref:protein VAC14 homolog n=1 Tax=Bradysia coprophila TaxID=38358 RepID=UPI00187DA1D8|nr:protein VAC14 homolog [Bradysia coprophila]
MESSYAPLTEACAKALSDKTYEKRKAAALEIEKMVNEFNKAKNTNQIRKLLNLLGNDFAISRDSNKRKGGLIGLAAVSIGLGKDSEKYINDLVRPILNCLSDPELKVRYFASESLYNVVKVARGAIVPLFPDIFSALSRLVTDPDQSVKNGSELLDRLLKDIVTENSQTFDLDSFIPLIRERVYPNNSFSRQFVISWVSVLNAVPEINMVVYLPEILDGLFQMLEDNMVEIHRMCETLLSQFLRNIQNDPSAADMSKMSNILIIHAQSTNELIQYTAIMWIREFVQLSGPKMLSFASGIFTAILPCLAYEGDSRKHIKETAQAVNKTMLELVSSKSDMSQIFKHLDLDSIMEVLRQYLAHSSVDTKVAVLKWIHHLFTEAKDKMSAHASGLFPVLLGILSDNSDEVVLQGLIVLAEIVNTTNTKDTNINKTHYRKFLISLLNLFSEEKPFLENRGSLIIRQLCVLLNAEFIYRTFAEIISEETVNVKFASIMVRTLHTILVTSSELFELRSQLKDIRNEKSASLFQCLYKSWCHCPISTLSLCLLAQCYQHCSELVLIFGDLEITVEFITEIDKLVQLIESPIFASLRLTLVSNNNNRADAKHLSQALFGILMLLPQTEAFKCLSNRLQCVPNYWGLSNQDTDTQSIQCQSKIDFNELLKHFRQIQKNHHLHRINQRKRTVALWDDEAAKDDH